MLSVAVAVLGAGIGLRLAGMPNDIHGQIGLALLIGTGAGAASRQSTGATGFSGMVAATVIGIVFVPVLFVAFQRLTERLRGRPRAVRAERKRA